MVGSWIEHRTRRHLIVSGGLRWLVVRGFPLLPPVVVIVRIHDAIPIAFESYCFVVSAVVASMLRRGICNANVLQQHFPTGVLPLVEALLRLPVLRHVDQLLCLVVFLDEERMVLLPRVVRLALVVLLLLGVGFSPAVTIARHVQERPFLSLLHLPEFLQFAFLPFELNLFAQLIVIISELAYPLLEFLNFFQQFFPLLVHDLRHLRLKGLHSLQQAKVFLFRREVFELQGFVLLLKPLQFVLHASDFRVKICDFQFLLSEERPTY